GFILAPSALSVHGGASVRTRVVEGLRIEGIDPLSLDAWAVLSEHGSRLATRSKEDVIQIWDIRSGLPHYKGLLPDSVVSQNRRTGSRLTMSVFSRDGALLALAFSVGKIRVLDTSSDGVISDFIAHEDPIRALHFSPDGRSLATVSANRSVKVWDPRTG